ncbi:MAG: endonuclease III domain-containing protein [Desulfomonilia bacterium]|jgi:endonuclease-3|uniref:Endonuclease III n=1 Tax=anaerobic digester metagenome TaxID=1263854 RepID=A0A485M5V5_9ZZZZ|nr:endonuclease III [Pseudomonadota bacterium]HON39488.1 endonuclease III [Deltaproteobacteria bacterium]HPD22569.1 endonuclease III [Deltaproteobacteria bacterium]HRS57423.1 endonuclease III [Desulfomonilia bacterium]HRV36478.1 endonuclease III [Desulfomonilia bacterium]
MHSREEKRPFDIRQVMERIRQAVQPFPKAALTQLAKEGHTSAFEQLMACIISARTFDETTLVCSRRLFALGRTPGQVAALDPALIERAIIPSSFHDIKALRIHAAAHRIVDEYHGVLPCKREVLLSLPGVGPKCANLVLAIACGENRISVDTHVHRITNRWGYIQTTRPEQSLRVLEERLPVEYWSEINRILVPFGKNICTSRLPRCSTCPVLDMCRQVKVTRHR